MEGIKGIIFDLDGVICRTDRYHYLAWKALADRLGLPFDESANTRLRGVSRMACVDILLGEKAPDYTREEKAALAEEKNRIYREYLRAVTPADLPEKTLAALQILRSRGYLLAIGSSSKNARLILKRLGLDSFFDAVADGTQITRTKPDPEVFLLAAAMLGVRPEEALVVEDAQAGICAAHAGGFHAAALQSSENQPVAEITIRHLEELTALL